MQVGGVDVPATLSMTLIVALVAFLLLITVVLQLYPGAVAIVLSYLLAVHVFNGSDLTTQFSSSLLSPGCWLFCTFITPAGERFNWQS